MSCLEAYRAAESLERCLGDPLDPERALSFQRILEWDEASTFPGEAAAPLEEWGLAAYQVPRAYGGRLGSVEEMAALLRVLARRDLTVALTHGLGTYMGAINVWVAGSEAQRRELAWKVLAHRSLAVVYHERGNGSDLLASELAAVAEADGYSLSGGKWVINNIRRGAGMTLFARTSPAGGPRGFSLFLLDKEWLDESCYAYLPKIRTLGVRGCDIAGIRFTRCRVPRSALIGPAGAGLELTLRSFQVTRALMAALALGGADTALRATLGFALARGLYGETVFSILHARSVLAAAFIDLLVCEAVLLSALRGLHITPEQSSVATAAAKAFVVATLERTVLDLGVVLGARHYLREEHWWGIFQKIARDLPAIGVVHAGTDVCLLTVAAQLGPLLKPKAVAHQRDARAERLAALFTLERPLPELDLQRLALSCRGANDVLDGLELSLERLGMAEDAVSCEIRALGERVLAELARLARRRERIEARDGSLDRSPVALELAERYATLHAAAACLHLWVFNRQSLGEFFACGEWLILGMERMLAGPGSVAAGLASGPRLERVARELLRLYRGSGMFSALPLQLAASAPESPC